MSTRLSASAPAATARSTVEVSVVRTFDELDALTLEWSALMARSGCRNPFAEPVWAITWARHFVAEPDLCVLAVRAPELIGVVPLYVHRRGGGAFTTIRPMGEGRNVKLFEMPQAVVAPGQERKVLRHAVEALYELPVRWDAIELRLTPEQGWFEPQWIPSEPRRRGSFVLHRASDAYVVMDLPADPDRVLPGLKHNVRESIRRSRNRLSRAGDWRVRAVGPEAAPAAVHAAIETLIALHEDRHQLSGKVAHGSVFDEPGNRAFLFALADRCVPTGIMRPLVLELAGDPIAGLLALRANDGVYVSFTGMRSDLWDLGAVTALLAAEAVESAAAGYRHLNLSLGPDVAKLRWSEQLEVHQSFLAVSHVPRSRAAVGLALPIRAAADFRREHRRHRSR